LHAYFFRIIYKEELDFSDNMVKCDLCGQKIETTFLGKLVGTVAKDSKGKKKNICKNCQSEHGKDLKEKLD